MSGPDPAERPVKFGEGLIGSRTGPEAIRRRADERDQAMAKVVTCLRSGMKPEEAMILVGRKPKTFYTWMYQSPRFAAQAKAAQEAWFTQQAKAELGWRERQDEFGPVRRADYRTWTEWIVAFRKAYFGFDTFDHQWKILQAYESSPAGGITLILIPPEWTKTTLICDITCAELCENPNMRVALISEGQNFASKTMARIQRRFTHDSGPIPPLIEHFGPFMPLASDHSKRWNAEEFTLLASDHDEQDPSVISVGIYGAIRGTRWDRVRLDDVQSVRKLGDTERIMRVFRGDVITRPGTAGKIEITGSRVGREDWYGELERQNMLDEVITIPALNLSKPVGEQSNFPPQFDEAGLPILAANGDQLGWTDAQLAQRRQKVGEDEWQRVYMQRPQSDFSAMITELDIANATQADRRPCFRPENAVSTIISLDPALAGHAAFTVCGYDALNLDVVDVVDLFQPTTNQRLYAEIERLTMRYRPDWWVIENNTLQTGYLTDDAFIAIKDAYGFNAVGHHTGQAKSDVNSTLGIPAMMAAIVRGEIRFPTISENDSGFARLFDQLMAWRPDVPTKRLIQDEVTSLWFAYLLWKKLRDQVNYDLGAWTRDGLGSVTLYPDVKTNLVGELFETRERAAMTYEQMWDLQRGVPA